MRLHYLSWLLLSVAILPVILAEPDVFGDYFDDGMKLVDISQDAALRSCLSDGKTADKTKAAYDECYGQGYDFDDLAKAGGDDDGLPEELEEKEGCFYKKMGWVSEDNVMDEALIAADMEGLEQEIQEGFTKDVGTCVAWTGSFGERRKRSVGMETGGEGQTLEEVPSLMDSGRRAMGWVRKLVRKVRSPARRNSGGKKKCPKGDNECKRRRRKKRKGRKNTGQTKPGKDGKKKGVRGEGKNGRRVRNGRKGDTRKNRRGNGKKGGKGGSQDGQRRRRKKVIQNRKKGGNGKNGNKCKGKKRKDCNKRKKSNKEKGTNTVEKKNENNKRKRKNDGSLPEAVYNKLWCIDLAIEQALEKCVEAKIQN